MLLRAHVGSINIFVSDLATLSSIVACYETFFYNLSAQKCIMCDGNLEETNMYIT